MNKLPSIVVVIAHMEGPLKGQVQHFSQSEITIGRHPSCDIRFPANQSTISRKHAKIIRIGNRFRLIDTSSNGTLINSKRETEAWLKEGDVLTMTQGGPQFGFVTEISATMSELDELEQFSTPPAPQLSVRQTPTSIPPAESTPPQKPASPPLPGSKVKASVVIQHGPTIRSFDELPITIGNSPKCDFQLNLDLLFDEHAQIFFAGGEYWIKDLTGQKKVICNDVEIESQKALQKNDEIGLTSSGPFFKFLGGGRFAELEKV